MQTLAYLSIYLFHGNHGNDVYSMQLVDIMIIDFPFELLCMGIGIFLFK
uniref:Uncharacterized protein n=1 Tax=Rhizophora mucronata TaxID=61149 RepID=A0A2P2Q855_RHIMU